MFSLKPFYRLRADDMPFLEYGDTTKWRNTLIYESDSLAKTEAMRAQYATEARYSKIRLVPIWRP